MISLPLSAFQFKRIVLTGFMGSGKTTVGRRLARSLRWQFVDLDEQIEVREGQTVPQIFAQRGEPAFRDAETRALAELLGKTEIIIALGGGAAGTTANHDLLHGAGQTAVVHLDAPFQLLFERCTTQALDSGATARPLLGQRTEAEARYKQRSDAYASLAGYRVEASGTPEAVAAAILAVLESQH